MEQRFSGCELYTIFQPTLRIGNIFSTHYIDVWLINKHFLTSEMLTCISSYFDFVYASLAVASSRETTVELMSVLIVLYVGVGKELTEFIKILILVLKIKVAYEFASFWRI